MKKWTCSCLWLRAKNQQKWTLFAHKKMRLPLSLVNSHLNMLKIVDTALIFLQANRSVSKAIKITDVKGLLLSKNPPKFSAF